MKKHHHRSSFARVLVLLAAGLIASVPAKEVKVQGMVSGKNHEGLNGVTVRAEKNGRILGNSVKTADGGVYNLVVSDIADFDVVYSISSHHPSVLEKLSGERDHSINKVLYQMGEERLMSAVDIRSVMDAYEYQLISMLAAGAESGEKVNLSQREFGREGMNRILTISNAIEDDNLRHILTNSNATSYNDLAYLIREKGMMLRRMFMLLDGVAVNPDGRPGTRPGGGANPGTRPGGNPEDKPQIKPEPQPKPGD